MTPEQIRQLGPQLERFLALFDDCFPRCDTRAHLPVYVCGLLSDLPRKSVEPIALAAGMAPRTLQEFLSLLDWDDDRLRDRVQQLVAREHACPHAVGIFDDTACAKKGRRTPGVQRQYCNATGKLDNCVVTVHLAYAANDFHCLLDSDLYLPASWDADRQRCRDAGIPDGIVYRPKWRIALEQLDRATANGVTFSWLTFDEGYGSKPEFLRELRRRRQRFVAEVPISTMGWLRPPRLRQGPRGGLRPTRPARRLDHMLLHDPILRDQPWTPYRVKDGQKGPMVWEAKHSWFHAKTEDGDPGPRMHLVVARDVLNRDVVKFFLGEAPAETPVATVLLVGFSRWHEERCFEDEKTELGFDHYEGRTYCGLIRHQRLTALAHLFCGRVKERLRGEKSRGNGVPGTAGGRRARPVPVPGPGRSDAARGPSRRAVAIPPTLQRPSPRQPHPANARSVA